MSAVTYFLSVSFVVFCLIIPVLGQGLDNDVITYTRHRTTQSTTPLSVDLQFIETPIYFNVSRYFQDIRCLTPDQNIGKCINIRQCKQLLDLLSQRNNPKVAQFLKNSHCGFVGADPKVCCPLKNFQDVPAIPRTPPRTGVKIPEPGTCGFSNASTPRVIDGHPAELGAFPWLTALGYKARTKKGPRFLCGGSLITERHVLTAGHCIYNRTDLYMVRLGEHNLESDEDGATPIDVSIAKKKYHEEYNPVTYTNDIGLIWLEHPVETTLRIRPICLPLTSDIRAMDFVRRFPFVAGWGTTYFSGPSSAALLMHQLPVVEQDQCKTAYKRFKTTVIDDRVMCAGFRNGGKDVCQGDSGGPLMYPKGSSFIFYVIGIVSYGYRCAEPGYPGVYTRVTYYVDWITSNLD